MVKRIGGGVTYSKGRFVTSQVCKDYQKTIAHGILAAHCIDGPAQKTHRLKLKFDALASHDITYVGIIQTAKGSGLKKFPVPYVLTNCHNSLCAVGGTINEDDHVFGLSAAKKYGGGYVPAHLAVIHSFMRESYAGAGKMILGSDSHTRYGALGTLGIGEGGPELVKQLVGRTYDVAYPDIIAVHLTGKPKKGVGPQDVALCIIGEVFKDGFVKNKILEFVGDGIKNLSQEYRNGIDVMTTETACLSSIWQTDAVTEQYLKQHGRAADYKALEPGDGAYYDGALQVDLGKIQPMIALPHHPSNVFKLSDVISNARDILPAYLHSKISGKRIAVQQGYIGGCAGGLYDNIAEAANILQRGNPGCGEFSLSVYPGSQPVAYAMAKTGLTARLTEAGAVVKTAFCGPCFGAGDVPANGALSVRHATRNFESREGSKPGEGQTAAVALMDARSIAATAANGGILTSALGLDYDDTIPPYGYNGEIYNKRVYYGFGKADKKAELKYGPNIKDWPKIQPLPETLRFEVAAAIYDPVTTTDELIPSGETSSYRSNPLRLAEFTLSRKDPAYVGTAKALAAKGIGSAVYAVKPGDGSAREQAASCQRVLGGVANIAKEYATKRYRSNLINWGMLPFISGDSFEKGDVITVKDVRSLLINGAERFPATLERGGKTREIILETGALTTVERRIILEGCLMNYYASQAPA